MKGIEPCIRTVAFFDVPAYDFKKAKEFYERVFDWKVDLWAMRERWPARPLWKKKRLQSGGTRRHQWWLLQAQIKKRLPVVVQTDSIDQTLKAIEGANEPVSQHT